MVRPQRRFHHIQHRYLPGLPLQDRFSQGYPWRLSWMMSLQMPSLIGSYPGRFGPMLGFLGAGGGHEENPQNRLKSRAHGFSEDGAGGGGRTHTVSLPTDFESVMSAIPSHRQEFLFSIIHFREKSKEKVQAGRRLRHGGKTRRYLGGNGSRAGRPPGFSSTATLDLRTLLVQNDNQRAVPGAAFLQWAGGALGEDGHHHTIISASSASPCTPP